MSIWLPIGATSDEALGFFKAGLMDKAPGIRMTALQALSRMPREVIPNTFATELQQIIADADETPKTRDRARQVFIQ